MFTVDKTTLPRFWYAGGNKVQEQVGTPLNDYEFADKTEAYIYAYNQKSEHLRREYQLLANRFSRTVVAIYKLRSLWNPRIAEGLKSWKDKVAQAKQAYVIGPKIEVVYLPNQIPVEGDRLAIGTQIYQIDSWNPKIQAYTIDREEISYYPYTEKGVVYYYFNGGNAYVKGDLVSGYSNVEFFLDREKAVARIRSLIDARIQEMNEMLKTL